MQSKTEQHTQFFSPGLHWLILGFLFVSAFYIRTYHLDTPPLDLHPTRQYHSATLARRYYLEALDSIPDWRRQVIQADKQRRDIKEPPIMELLASFAYRVARSEHLWIPRMLASIFWLTGAVFLYLLAKEMFCPDAALFSTAVYLFLPYGIIASRNFQPDPLMVMMLIGSIYAIFRYNQHPSKLTFAIAVATSAFALFVKPVCIFYISIVFIFLTAYRTGLRKSLFSWQSFLFALLACLPSAVYYGYSFVARGFIKYHVSRVILPHLILNSFFWVGWFHRIEKVVGLIPLIGALLGTFISPKKQAKVLIAALWVAYLVYSVVNTYTTYTHDYYHLPLIPLVALALGPIAAPIAARLSQMYPQRYWRLPILALIFLTVFLLIYQVKPRLPKPNAYENYVKIAKEIGQKVNHSTKTVFLAHFYGAPLTYYGEISGKSWPNRGDFVASTQIGEYIPPAEERFNTQYANESPEFFIVTDLRALQQQPDLVEFLSNNFPVFAQTRNYVIFDLRKIRR